MLSGHGGVSTIQKGGPSLALHVYTLTTQLHTGQKKSDHVHLRIQHHCKTWACPERN